jgi:hypothetical protein
VTFRNLQFGCLLFVAAFIQGCKPPTEPESRLQWGVHQSARSANILNLLPNQSVEVCADKQDWVAAGHEAIQKWATAIGRWGHIKIVQCGQTSDLTINLQGFDSTGLNYFTARPGKIFMKSSASGNFLRAIALHEFGHSFGLCDQYKDAGSSNCSDARSERQQNSEVMGATNASKLNLTLGDIEGVRKAASDLSIRANSRWQNYLSNASPNQQNSQPQSQPLPQPQTLQRKVFARLVAGSASDRPKLAVSAPAGSSVAVCRYQFGLSSCTSQSSQYLVMQKANQSNGREFYVSTQDLAGLNSSGNLIFVVTVKDSAGAKTEKFAIKRR